MIQVVTRRPGEDKPRTVINPIRISAISRFTSLMLRAYHGNIIYLVHNPNRYVARSRLLRFPATKTFLSTCGDAHWPTSYTCMRAHLFDSPICSWTGTHGGQGHTRLVDKHLHAWVCCVPDCPEHTISTKKYVFMGARQAGVIWVSCIRGFSFQDRLAPAGLRFLADLMTKPQNQRLSFIYLR